MSDDPIVAPGPDSSALVAARGVSKIFPSGNRTIRVLEGVDFDVHAGETVAITGASGAGKSTFLHILGLLDVPTGGEVRIGGRPTSSLSEADKADIRSSFYGFVFQFYHLLPELTALENVLLPSMIRTSWSDWSRVRPENRARAYELLEAVRLADRASHRPGTLSGGERQRVAIARALMNRPRVVLCDEPTGNLDSRTSGEIVDLLVRLGVEHSQTFVIVTHEMSLARIARRILRLQDGSLVAETSGSAA